MPTKTKRKTTKKTPLARKLNFSRQQVSVVLGLAVVLGIAILIKTFASGTPVYVEKTTNQAFKASKTSYAGQPIDARLYSTGLLLCGNRSALYYKTLTSAQMSSLMTQVQNAGVLNLAHKINYTTSPTTISQTIKYSYNGRSKRSTLWPGAVPSNFLNVTKVLSNACYGVTTPYRGQIPRVAGLAAPSTGAIAKVRNFIARDVFASGIDTGAEGVQYYDTNNARAQNGVAGVAYSGCLSQYARVWAQQMAANGGISHNPNYAYNYTDSSGHVLIGGQVTSCGNVNTAGENVGVGGSSQVVFDAFMNSQEHRNNILDRSYSAVGEGAYVDGNGTYWIVQDYCGGCGGSGSSPGAGAAPPPQPAKASILGRVWVNSAAGQPGGSGAILDTCGWGQVSTDGNGFYSFQVPVGQLFCIRSVNFNGYTINQEGELPPGQGSYEWQVAGQNCYHVCGGDLRYNLDSGDSGFDFQITSGLGWPPPTYTVIGRLWNNASAGQPAGAGAKLDTCGNGQPTSDANGYFAFAVPQGRGFCIRPMNFSAYTLVAQGNLGTRQGSYEWQIAGFNCYATCINITPYYYDRDGRYGGGDYGYDFQMTSGLR